MPFSAAIWATALHGIRLPTQAVGAMDGSGSAPNVSCLGSDSTLNVPCWSGSWAEFEDVSTSFPNEDFPVDVGSGDLESPIFASHFYDEPEDVTRHVNSDTVAFGSQSAFGDDHCKDFFQDSWQNSLSLDPIGPLSIEDGEARLPRTSVRFLADEVPPTVPKTSFFKLLPTTLRVTNTSALDLANAMIAICTSRGWSVVKVNHAKFTIKVQVWEHGLTCTMKVRMYERDGCVVEFSRRSGDGLAFAAAFAGARAVAESCVV